MCVNKVFMWSKKRYISKKGCKQNAYVVVNVLFILKNQEESRGKCH